MLINETPSSTVSSESDDSGFDHGNDTTTMKKVTGKIHPVYVLGMDAGKLSRLRAAYTTQPSSSEFGVGFYRIQNYSVLSQRIGLEPSVVIMMEHIHIADSVATFLKRYRTPVLRVMKNPCEVAQLSPEYYYGGVYDTCAEEDLFQTTTIQYHINLGVMIWARNMMARVAMTKVQREQIDSVWDPRGSRFRRCLVVPKPEASWYDFVSKYGRLGSTGNGLDSSTDGQMQPA